MGPICLRRAMGKKIKEAMDAERPKFLEGSKKNGVDKAKAQEVWDLLEKFANYGFNKSHAAAYAVVSYQTGWLKANHPVEFMAGVMNCDIHLTDKLAVYAEEVRRGLEIEIVPPCVNRSEAMFSVADGKVVYALGALKNVGVEAMRLIVEARRGGGDGEAPGQARGGAGKPFVNLFDFARRVDMRKVGKRPLEMLARAGAFDELDPNRRRVFEALDPLVAYSAAIHDQRASNQTSLFGEAGDDLPEPRLSPVNDWLPNERLGEEHTGVGFYLSGHPLDEYMAPLKRKQVKSLAEVEALVANSKAAAVKMAGSVAGRQERKSAKGNRFAFVQLSDPTGLYEVMVFSDTLEASREFLEPGMNIVLGVEATYEAEQLKLLARSASPVDDMVADAGQSGLKVFLEEEEAVAAVAALLDRVKGESGRGGRGQVELCLTAPDLPGEVEMDLPGVWPVSPQIKSALKSLPGSGDGGGGLGGCCSVRGTG